MALWKDLIDIPTEVHKNDFVLKLTEGVQKKEQTIKTYVVTPQIADRFDQTLTLIKSAVEGEKSVAAYLHGSFGSGKSHFMAVLNLLLEGFPAARKLENLGKVVAKHQEWVERTNFLMVPYHFMNATSMESAILGGYVDFIRRNHPHAPIPGVYISEKILNNADDLRKTMGDEKFFATLNAGKSGGSGGGKWGKLSEDWSAGTYDAARDSEPGSEKLTQLVGDVVARLLPAMMDTAKVGSQGFVSLDEGLETISRHAKNLPVTGQTGTYDGLILFLDELVLWLASRAGDIQFLDREGPKISKLIEAQHADREVPIISFVAKQRDLREFIGEQHLGIEQFRVWQQLQYWDRGLDTIKLEDRNLPVIVHQRLLKPHDDLGKENIRQSFKQTVARMRTAERDIMLGSEADEELFAAVFPFSPVLVQALIALSALLHRERTALRLLLMLLVKRRDDLELGQIIPVGDLWDVISDQHEPFSDVILQTFRAAQKLYDTRLRPMLLQTHGIEEGDAPESHLHFRNDDRIVKTLLISTLVPGIEAFKGLTAERLVALNYGAVKTPIPGAETSTLVQKLRHWQTIAGEIRVSEDDPANPTVSLQLSNVDLDALLGRVQAQDSEGNRRRKVQELLFGWFNLSLTGSELWTQYKLDWRGAQRQMQVSYRNVREMTLDHLESDGERFQLVIDYPFDEDGKFPSDDRAKLQEYRDRNDEGTDTLAWLPAFLSDQGTRLLGRLVCIDYLLERFEQQVEHLAASDRPTVKAALSSQRTTIREQLRQALRVAYGIDQDPQNPLVDHVNKPPRHLESLREGFEPRVPGGVPFDDALRLIAEKALEVRYPGAPKFPHESITKGRVQKMADEILGIIETGESGGYIENRDMRRDLKAWGEPLDLGQMGDNRFAPGGTWRDRFNRGLPTGDEAVEVRELRRLLEPDNQPRGLPSHLQDLVILVYAAQENMVFRIGGSPVDASIGDVPDGAHLVHRKMPSDAAWERACVIAREVFGVSPGRVKNARNVERLVADMARAAEPQVVSLKQVPEKLVEVSRSLDVEREQVERTDRHRTAVLLRDFVQTLDDDASDAIEALAKFDASSDDLAGMKLGLERASSLLQVLKTTQWSLFEKVAERDHDAARGLLNEAREVLANREQEARLETFRELCERAVDVIPKPPGPGPGPKPPVGPKPLASMDVMVSSIDELAARLKGDEQTAKLFEQGALVHLEIFEKP